LTIPFQEVKKIGVVVVGLEDDFAVVAAVHDVVVHGGRHPLARRGTRSTMATGLWDVVYAQTAGRKRIP
jgi:hypothetical protein